MFQFLKKYSNIILAAAVVIILLFYIDGCRQNNASQDNITNLLEYEHIVKTYKAKDGSNIDYNNTLEVKISSLKATNDSILDYLDNLNIKIRNVYNSTIITETLRIDTLEIPVYLTDCEFDTTIQVIDSNYFMDINLTNHGLTFNTLQFPNRVGITVAEKREKWWKRKESIVAVTNSNPYMNIEGITSYIIQQDQKWYQKWWVHLLGGVAIGGITTYSILK